MRYHKGYIALSDACDVADTAIQDYDAIAEIEVDGCVRSVGIEYERSAKSMSRYQAACAALDKGDVTDAVLYITPNDDILYLLAMELRATRKRLGFVLSETFHSMLLEARTLTNANGSEIVPLRALFKPQRQ